MAETAQKGATVAAEGSEGTGETDQGAAPDAQLEAAAREMGWVPKTEFRGDQTKWVDAGPYVKRGETVLPIVRAENRQLRSEVQGLRGQLAQRTAAEAELRASIDELRTFNTEVHKDRVKATRATVAAGIKKAREDGDIERELELRDQLDEANAALRESEAAPTSRGKTPAAAASSTTDPTIGPEMQAWQAANPWFGQEARKTNYALAVAKDIRESSPQLVGTKAFFDKVSEEVNAVFSPPQRPGASKVEGGNGSTNPGGGGSRPDPERKTFADLPAEAQAVARAQSKRFAGPNKAFKTEAEWFSNYVTQYFAQE